MTAPGPAQNFPPLYDLSRVPAGPVLVVAGTNTGLPLPAAGLTALVPPLSGLTHWYRAAGPAVGLR